MKPIILSNLFVVALLICLTVKYGSSLKYYECESYRLSPYDNACAKVDPSMIKECPVSSKVMCSTLKVEEKYCKPLEVKVKRLEDEGSCRDK